MTVFSLAFRTDWYAADGLNKDWSYDFALIEEAVVVQVRDAAGVISEFTSNFTFFPTDDSSGFVRYPAVGSALAAGNSVRITRWINYTQPTAIGAQGRFNPELHERGLDRATIQIQQLKDFADRTIKLPVGEIGGVWIQGDEDEFPVYDDANGIKPSGITVDQILVALSTAGVTTSDTPPLDPLHGRLWYDTSSGNTFIWVVDEDSSQWVQLNVNSPSSPFVLVKKITPRMYGAKSDGSDSTAAFQAWAADVVAGVGWGSVDAETYHVSDDIAFTGENIALEVNGTIIQTGTAKKTLKFTGVNGLRLFGGNLVGKGTEFVGGSTAFNGAAGVYLDACNDVNIESLKLSNHAGGGLRWINGLVRATITGVVSQGIGPGLIAAGENGNDVGIGGIGGSGDQGISIIAPKVYDHAFGLFAYDCADLAILDPLIFDIIGQHGIYLSEVPSYTIRGGRIERCGLEGIKSQIAKDVDLAGPCIIDGLLVIDTTSHGINIDTIPTYTATRRHVDVRLSNLTVRGSGGIGVSVAETTRLSARNIDIMDSASYGMFLDRTGGSISDLTALRTDLSGLFMHNGMYLGTGLHLRDIRLIDTALNTVAGASSQHVYAMYGEAQTSTFPLYIDGLEISYLGSEPATLSRAFRLNTNVVADMRRLTNRTTKGWQTGTAPTHFGPHVSNVGEATTAVLNPTTPISGHARREFYGTQDPATAGMTRAFSVGDICWHATPAASGTIGWVCTVAGSPGTWKSFGTISA